MSVQSEGRWKARCIAEHQAASHEQAQREVFIDGRAARPTMTYVPSPVASKREARNWMRLHAHEYETATELAEACNAALPLPEAALDPDGWAWDLALEAQS